MFTLVLLKAPLMSVAVLQFGMETPKNTQKIDDIYDWPDKQFVEINKSARSPVKEKFDYAKIGENYLGLLETLLIRE